MTRKSVRLLVGLVLCLALIGGVAAWQFWPGTFSPPAWTNDYDVSAREPELIAPGTVVGDGPPKGWSHLVIKSLPRVKPGSESQIPAIWESRTVRMMRWLFTAFVADVQPENRGGTTRYHLRAIGLGLGTSVNGQDVVITPETAKAHGVELDWITREILTKGYQTQALAMIVVQSPAFALVDTPVWYRFGEKNRLIRFRYALLVDAESGKLDVLCWMLDTERGTVPEKGVLVPPNLVDPAELIPDREGFDRIGIASDSAFGVDSLPPHREEFELPRALRGLAVQTRFKTDDARTLETGLRRLIAAKYQ